MRNCVTVRQFFREFIFRRISSFLKLRSCLMVLLAARINKVFPSFERLTGAHLPLKLRPTIFCQFPEMILSTVSSSPIPQSSQTFSTKVSIERGCREVVSARSLGKPIKLEIKSSSFDICLLLFLFKELSFLRQGYTAMKLY